MTRFEYETLRSAIYMACAFIDEQIDKRIATEGDQSETVQALVETVDHLKAAKTGVFLAFSVCDFDSIVT